ncbi:hypothetical protein [Photobacterium damselae]|uniref:hypothetical protein n=1 Tax=Photobacterium damselae TaxID=38293 RepID=UPI0015F60A8F|nr:hypothetical protein [Photobacterium damselae]MBA5684103.1 hypothetical protein [Photobacterium damselae subsp. damselae]MBA5684112.1 hypothetical protein [Photobacterium damselae subsp. damselae]
MAVCVLVNQSNNVLVASSETINNCAGYVLVSADEYKSYLAQIIDFSATDITQLILLGFVLVLSGYLLAKPVGIVIQFIKRL